MGTKSLMEKKLNGVRLANERQKETQTRFIFKLATHGLCCSFICNTFVRAQEHSYASVAFTNGFVRIFKYFLSIHKDSGHMSRVVRKPAFCIC